MKKTTRTFLFSAFFISFLLATPVIIAYSRGYRVDWGNKIILNTGALMVEPRPAPVELFVDGQYHKRSSFLFQNIYVDNLIAKTYLVEAKRDGYFTWSKMLQVAPHLVTEAKNVVLFPSNSTSTLISSGVEFVSTSPGERYAVLAYLSTSSTQDRSPVVEAALYDFESGTQRVIFRGDETLIGYTVQSIEWNNSSTRIFFHFQNANNLNRWIAVDIRDPQLQTIDISAEIAANSAFRQYENEIFKPAIDSVSWQPNNQSSVLFVVRDLISPKDRQLHILASYNLESKILSEPIAYDVSDYEAFGDNAMYISSKLHTLNRVNINARAIDQLTFNPIFGAENIGSTQFVTDRILLAGEEGDKQAMIYNSQTQSFDIIANKITKAVVSSDSKKILLQGKNTISVYWLENVHIQPFRDAGDIEEIIKLPESEVIDSVWFTKDNEHIIFSANSSINVTELDGRDKRNTHTLYGKSADNLIYMGSKDILYFRSEGNFLEMPIK
ncbi:MAG: hypothetical protein A2754_01330 [Candidatus Magasanikbacteria bacterium RIFCSPHIGHO2_01_FULL_47_8]|uniref:PEGA domain-containing protein n=1 Tax=Candidatus Magasanikbacteria bacterium RIFCSPHIGHO2_01_FULL_47_8 TaxID=1798673 RepID=A0A1F6MBJ1_9BACT|nr:MAG: hypothetical protein A2754_01330 [Candidatus Magasanikbacteria bacterium RIFCSPHIGHO2_01_FULL_47_8]